MGEPEPAKSFLRTCLESGNIVRTALENPELRANVVNGLRERKALLVVVNDEKEASIKRADGHRNVRTKAQIATAVKKYTLAVPTE